MTIILITRLKLKEAVEDLKNIDCLLKTKDINYKLLRDCIITDNAKIMVRESNINKLKGLWPNYIYTDVYEVIYYIDMFPECKLLENVNDIVDIVMKKE